MAAEGLIAAAGMALRLLGLSTGVFTGRVSRLLRRMAQHHLQLAQEEAAEEAQRVLQGALLIFLALVCLSCALLMSNLVVVMALRELAGVDWLRASLGALGLDVVLTVLLGLAGASVLKKPYMPRTRKTMGETFAILRDEDAT